MGEKLVLYINGQDIARLSLGLLRSDFSWVSQPEILALSPEAYLSGLENYLKRQGIEKTHLEGLAVVAGPGSATALRTSHSLANGLVFALRLNIWSVPALDSLENSEVAKLFLNHQPQPSALPTYSAAPKITASTRDQLKRKPA